MRPPTAEQCQGGPKKGPRQVLDMVATIVGHRPPAVARRGLA
ncbi:hypothetical protein [Streptomyces antnestii]|nr:hypothetical protein [Streptomyces sp. San01]